MYVDNIKVFTKNEKELETLIQTIRIYSQDLEIEFGCEKCVIMIMKNGKRESTEEIVNKIKNALECSEIRKTTCTCEYWKRR